MELKAGYKVSEVGTIPESWEAKALHSVLDKGRLGGNYPNRDVESEFPLMKMGNLARGRFDLSRIEFIVPEVTPDSQHLLHDGDVVFNTRNTLELVGKVALWRGELPVAYYNSNLMRLEFDPAEICSGEYANYALNTAGAVARLRALATGTTSVAAIYTRDLMGLHIAVPPESEQRAIAAALSDVDALLDGLDRLIAKKRNLKQAAMQQLLTGQTRLPGFNVEWEEKRVGELGLFLKGSGVTKDQANSGSLACIRYGELYTRHDNVIRSFYSWISPEVAMTAVRLRRGDILFAGSGETKSEIGKGAAFVDEREAYAGGDIVILRSHNADPVFLGYFLNCASINQQKASRGQGDAVVHITASALAEIECWIPDPPEQAAIGKVLSDMDAEIAVLEARRDKTRDLKQAMMQELLTGRTRLIELAPLLSTEATAQKGGRQANVHFTRSVLAAEIIERMHEHPTFGHVKLEKMMFLVEHQCGVDTGSTYYRKAAGPYDNRALRSIDSQLRKQQWFEARKEGARYRYVPMKNRGGHKSYFDRYFSDIDDTFGKIIGTFMPANTEQCEIVATLMAAWTDLLRERRDASDASIVHEVLNNWHESKQRIAEARWLKALGWMRTQGLVPRGVDPDA